MSARPPLSVNLETDDRTVLFPSGKYLTHISVQPRPDERIKLEAVYTFNEAREPTEIADISLDNAYAFGRAIIDAVYQGRTQHVITEELRITVLFNVNGFTISFGSGKAVKDLFTTSAAVLRLAHAVLRVADTMDAAPAN